MKEQAITYPSFTRNSQTPLLAPSLEGGIAIACPPVVYAASSTVLPVHGVFIVPKRDAQAFPGNLMQGVVLVLRGPCLGNLSLGDGRLFFDDDISDEGEIIRGYFNLDLFTTFRLERVSNRYWISASILQHVSSVLTVEVAPGRQP